MGSFILIHRNTNLTSAGGVILDQVAEATPEEKLIFAQESSVTAQQRQDLFGHKSFTVWLTGLSGSGKSTIARMLEKKLLERNMHACILDGDNLRHGLNADLGFSPEDRSENIRRAAQVARLMNDAGLIVIAAFISPYHKDRAAAAEIIGENFKEVYIDATIQACRKRDPKGLYDKFDQGVFTGMTGIDSPYEIPESPLLHVKTECESVEESVARILDLLG